MSVGRHNNPIPVDRAQSRSKRVALLVKYTMIGILKGKKGAGGSIASIRGLFFFLFIQCRQCLRQSTPLH
jgi:hypothetical protein